MSNIIKLDDLQKSTKPGIYLPRGTKPVFTKGTRKIKIFVGMLSPDTLIDTQVMTCVERLMISMANMRHPDGSLGYSIHFESMRSSNIFTGRQKLAELAVMNEADYLLFIDSDMTFPAESLHQLVCHGKDIVSALAFKKAPPYSPVMAMRLNPEDPYSKLTIVKNWVSNTLIEVDGVGTAFMLIKCDVFKKMSKPWFFFHEYEDKSGMLGSDYFFCAKAKDEAKAEVWVDTNLPIGHLGSYPFGIKDYLEHGGMVKPIAETDDPAHEFEVVGKIGGVDERRSAS